MAFQIMQHVYQIICFEGRSIPLTLFYKGVNFFLSRSQTNTKNKTTLQENPFLPPANEVWGKVTWR